MDKRIIPMNNMYQFETSDLKYNTDISTGMKLFMMPETTAPLIFEKTSTSVLMGARSSLSNDLAFLSKVIVTASIDVVPKRIDMATIPANISTILKELPDLKKTSSSMQTEKLFPS